MFPDKMDFLSFNYGYYLHMQLFMFVFRRLLIVHRHSIKKYLFNMLMICRNPFILEKIIHPGLFSMPVPLL